MCSNLGHFSLLKAIKRKSYMLVLAWTRDSGRVQSSSLTRPAFLIRSNAHKTAELAVNRTHSRTDITTAFCFCQLASINEVFKYVFRDPRGPSPGRTWQYWDPAHLPGYTAEPYNPKLEIRHQGNGRWWHSGPWDSNLRGLFGCETGRASPAAIPPLG